MDGTWSRPRYVVHVHVHAPQTQPAQTQAPPKSTPASSNYLHDLVVANSTPHLPHLAIFIIITAPVTSLPRVFSLSRSC
ncbi:hypothetical protein CEP54_015723 [Fusarium duplospermum]|uniref:Uncharacterized protein n=1 Tax=Fusarium duplospermum TaxID=1325734 RepID=A0A428NLV2_9HYPO|nr:hypothetical protein CEP54_015723 [Fusarium duplospermum]